MIKNTIFNLGVILGLTTISLPAYSHAIELPHTHTGIEYLAVIVLAIIITLRLIKK